MEKVRWAWGKGGEQFGGSWGPQVDDGGPHVSGGGDDGGSGVQTGLNGGRPGRDGWNPDGWHVMVMLLPRWERREEDMKSSVWTS